MFVKSFIGSFDACNRAHKQRVKDVIHQLDETYTLEMMFD